MQINKKNYFGTYAIIEKNKSILLVKKSRGPYKGKLDLPGGRPEHGETIAQALIREVLEETGVFINAFKFFANYTVLAVEQISANEADHMHHIGAVYRATQFNDSNLCAEINLEDSLGAQWYTIDTLTQDQLSPFAYSSICDLI
jgi:8-oxo-dGTP diphosphatase